MARYMSMQYPNKNPGHQRNCRKGDRNKKKGDDPKYVDKDINATGTTGAHIEDITTPEDSTTPSGGSSIGAHVSEVTEQLFWPTQFVEDMLGVHSIGDAIWGGTNPCDVSVDTANSTEIMADSHIIEEQTFIFCRSDQDELLNMTSDEPCKENLLQD